MNKIDVLRELAEEAEERADGVSYCDWAITARMLWKLVDELDHPVAEQGTCSLCGQEMIRWGDDAWHPAKVSIACPPEVGMFGFPKWGRAGRPGVEYFVKGNG